MTTEILPNAQHIREFYGGFTGTCGETALSVALASALGNPRDKQGTINLMLAITHQMQAASQASSNGASTLWDLGQEARRRGASVALEWDYAEPFPHDWHQVLLDNAGKKPIVLQIARAYNLHGQLGTGSAEAGVHYHFICVVGIRPEGFICADGDNWDIENTYAIYSYDTLAAAVPCGLLMLNMSAGTTSTSSQGGQPTTVLNMDTTFFGASGTGWKAKATGQVIDHGMLDFYRANDGLFRLGLPLTGEMGQPWGGTIQVFERGALAFDPHSKYDRPWGVNGPIYFAHIDSGVVRDWLTADLQRQLGAANVAAQQAVKERDAAKAVAANAQSLIDAANKAAEDAKASAAQAQADLKTVSSELESVKAQLAQLQAQPPVPAPLSQEQKDGLAALDAVAKYMKEAH